MLEPPRRGGSNEYPQSMFSAEICKVSEFLSDNFQFLEVKFSIYLNKCVFVMVPNNEDPIYPCFTVYNDGTWGGTHIT